MMYKIKEWDHWILDNIYQKVADWVWGIVPVSCFMLARGCLFLSQVIALIFALNSKMNIGLSVGASVLVFGIVYLWIYLAEEFTRPKFMNFYRENNWIWRPISFSLMLMGLISPDLFGANQFFYVSTLYFLACQPRPPIERTVLKGVFEGA